VPAQIVDAFRPLSPSQIAGAAEQLPALAKAGFRAVAPDLRGYGLSDRPEEVEKYTILHDIGDSQVSSMPWVPGTR
jgi:pimeloyl-ACP methyl ester carboxylesterase